MLEAVEEAVLPSEVAGLVPLMLHVRLVTEVIIVDCTIVIIDAVHGFGISPSFPVGGGGVVRQVPFFF